ncbi:MAG: T9SS type A sorting domain-containing protein [Paludibacteraceae bacterium]
MNRFNLKFAIIAVALFGTALCASAVTHSVSLNPNTTICPGEKVTITLTPDDSNTYTYKWTWKDKYNNSQSSSGNPLNDQPEVTTTYTYNAYDAGNAVVDAGTVEVTVGKVPTVTVDQSVYNVKQGENVTLQATGSFGTTSYQWYDALGNPIAGEVSANYTVSDVQADATYQVAALIDGCDGAKAKVKVHLYSLSAGAETVCYNTPVSLTAQGGANYYWSNGMSGQTITVYPTDVPTSSYTVTIKDADDALVATESITINVTALPTITGITPADPVTCNGEEVQVTATASTDKGTFTWSDGQKGHIAFFNPATTTNYWVQFTDTTTGCVSEKAYVTVRVTTPGIATINGPASACLGDNVTLSVSGGTPVRWYTDYTELGTGTTCTYTPTEVGTSTVYCNVNVDGCVVKAEKTITVSPQLSPTISGDLSICAGESATLTVSTPDDGKTTYKWNTNETTRSITVSPAITTSYSVEVTRNGCTATAGPVEVEVNTKPSISFTGGTSVCKGSIASITANVTGGSGSYMYAWNDPESTTSATLKVTPYATTTYTVTVTDVVTKCTNSAPVTINVTESTAPTITGPTQVCKGESFTLAVSTDCDSYQWDDEAAATTKTMTETLTADRTFTVKVVKDGCTYSISHKVTVLDGPTGDISGNNTFCPGGSTRLTAPVGESYLWITGATTQYLDVTVAGEYWVQVTKGSCTVTKKITVSENTPIVPVITPSTTTICAGESVTLKASNYGTITQWSDGAKNLGTETTITVKPTQTTTYTLAVTDVNGCTATAYQTITVNVIPTLTISGDKDKVCSGDAISVTVSGAASGSTYAWSKTGTLSNGNATLTFTPTDDDTEVSVTVTTASGCPITKTYIFAVIPKHTGEITGLSSVCKGETVTLYAPAGGTSYVWSNGKTGQTMTTDALNVIGTQKFTVDIIYADGCTLHAEKEVTVNDKPSGTITASPETVCLGEQVQLTANVAGATAWAWSNGTSGTNTIYVTPTSLGSVEYTVDVTKDGCTTTLKKGITVVEKPTAAIDKVNSTASVCKAKDPATIVATGGTKYQLSGTSTVNNNGIFTVNPEVTTTYTILVYNANDCETPVTHQVEVKGVEEPTISGSTKVCQGGNTTLTSSKADTYEWKKGATVLGNNPSIEIKNVQATDNYTLTITQNGCTISKSFSVEMVPLPTDAKIEGPDKVCAGTTITLTAKGNGSYKWSTGEETNTIQVTPTAADHIYQLTLTNDAGCVQTVQHNVTVNAIPTVSITGPDEVCAGTSVTLTAIGTGTFTWDDGTPGATLTLTPTVSRTYTVTITDANGCTNTASHTVNVLSVTTPIINGNLNICKGSKTILTASGDAGCTFEWSELGREGASVEVSPDITTTYTVIAKNAAGCTAEGKVTVNVHEPPTIGVMLNPASGIICAGETATITLTGGSEYTCGGVTNTTGIFNVSPTVTTPYNIIVTNSAGCSSSTVQTITVREKPTVTISGDKKACQNTKVTLTAAGAESYEWSTGETTENIVVDVTGTAPITVWVKGKNAAGCWSDPFTHIITVNATPNVTISGTLDICVGSSTTLTAAGASTYVWSWDGGSATGNTLEVSPTSDKVYTVEGTDANGCKATTSTTVKVYAKPVANITGDTEICEGGSAKLTASGGGSYLWSTGETTAEITVTAAGKYTVTVTGNGGCSSTATWVVAEKTITAQISGATTSCAGDEVSLTATGGDTYLWDACADITGIATSQPTVKVKPTSTTTYWVTVTKDGCSKRASHTVTIPAKSEIVISGKTDVCVGETFTLIAALDGASDFYWEGGPNSTSYTTTLNAEKSQTYTVHATDKNGCKVEKSITITSHALPIAGITGESSICKGSGVTLTATGGTSYKWGAGETSASIFVTPTATTTYTVVAYNAQGCPSAEASHTVKVNTPPIASISGPTQVCKGSTITLTAAGGTSYKWSTSETTQSITPTINSDITYSVVVTDANGCTGETTHTVKIYPEEQVVITGELEICAGSSTTLTASGVTGGTYQWNTGISGNTLTVSTAGTYTVTATYGNGCTSTASATVVVNPKPTVTITSSMGDGICPGESTVLTASAGQSYLWTPGNYTSQSITVLPAVETQYTVEVVDANGCTGTAKKTISIKTIPAADISGPAVSCAGEPVELVASGGSVLWKDDGSTVNPRTVNPTATTTYYGIITGTNGCSVEKSWTVKVADKPTLNIVGETTICYGESTTLTVSGADTYVWDHGLGSGSTVTVNPTVTTKYTVTGTDANGCTNSKDVEVIVNPIPTATITPDKTSVCEGEQITLTASGGDDYIWDNDDTGPTITVTPTAPSTTYSVVAYKNGCPSAKVSYKVVVNTKPTVTITASADKVCKGTEVTLTANGASTYLWSNGETTQSIKVTATADATYSVTGTTNGCSNTATKKITVNTPPTINVSGKLAICKGESTTLTASGAQTYTWSDGLGNNASVTVSPVVTTVYTVVGTDANGCTASKNVEVEVYDKPAPVINGATEICEGDYTTLTAVEANAVAWEWSTGAKTQSIDVYEAGTYTVTVTGKGGCTTQATAIVTYKTPVSGSISGGETAVCQGSTVILTASGGKTYKWDYNGFDSPTLTLTDIQTTGTYWVTITGDNGCTQRLSRTVIVNPKPTVDITGSLTFCEGGSTTLTAVGTGDVLWTTGATTKAITVTAEGDYEVTLTDANGCIATKSVHVTRNALPVAIITGSNEICEGESVTLVASGADSYTWDTGATADRITVAPTTTTTYTVTPRTGNCVGDPTAFTVTVNPKPLITFSGDTEVCEGETATIKADGADDYTWSNGKTGAAMTTDPLTATTTFVVTGTNKLTGCSAQAQYTVVVNPKPTITISGKKEICAGESTKLTVSPQGATYKWSNGSTERTASFDNLLDDTDFWVDVTLNGCTERYDGTITVHPIPVADITTNTGKTTVCRGQSITLTATGGTTYLWQHDGTRSASVTVTPKADAIYTVQVIGDGDCKTTASINITVLDLPNAKITADKTTVCEGDDVTLSASDGVRWQWYKGNDAISGAIDQHYTITGAAYGSTTYSVEVYNANDCMVRTSYSLVVQKQPVAEILGDLNICLGESTTLSAPDADSWLWSTGATTKTITVSPTADTDYTLTIKSGDCTSSITETVVVNTLPVPTLTATANTVCVGNSTVLTAGTGYKYYKWSTGQEGTNMRSISVSPTAKTTYTVEVTDASGCKGVNQITIDVTQIAPPTISVLTGNTMVCAAEEVILQASASNQYQWSTNVGLSQINNQTVVVYPTSTSIYTVTTTNKAGCSSSQDITITVMPLPTPKITGENNVCKGESLTLTATSDVAGATFLWSTNENTPTITVKPSKTTTYKVWASNGRCKNPTPAEITVTVNDLPAAAILGTSTICLGESTTLEATGGSTFLWKGMSGAEKTLAKITVSPTQTTTYTCTVTDDKGCSKDVSLEVVVNKLPTPTITGTTKICRGESTTLTASGGNAYLWTGDGIVTPGNAVQTVLPAYTTTYTVEVTNANGCKQTADVTVEVVQDPKVHIEGPTTICSGSAATLKVVSDDSRTYTYKWAHDGSTNATCIVKPLTTTTYNVEIFDGKCSRILSHQVTVNKIEDPQISGPAQICLGESTKLEVTNMPNPYVSYQWSTGETTQAIVVSPDQVGMSTYTVTVTDANECTAEATIDIVVKSLPVASVTQNIALLCEGDHTVTLTATGAGINGTYNWYEDDLATVPIALGTDNVTFTDLLVNKKVYVVAVDKFGCQSEPKEYELVVTPKPTPTITSSVPSNVLCEGGMLQLTASDPDPDVTFKWEDGTTGAHLTVTAGGEYRVTATNKAGCSQDASITITEELLPDAKITASIIAGSGAGAGTSICAGTRLKLTADPESSATMTYTYKWNTGSVAREITVNPTATKTYSVIVTSASGCSKEASIEVKVNEFVTIEGPKEVCAGQPYVLNAIGKNLNYYEWTRNGVPLPDYDDDASINCADSVPVGQPSADVVYGVKAVYDNNCESDTTFTVTIYAKPTDLTINGIQGIDAMDSVCVGSSKQLSVMPINGSSLTRATYNWTGVGIADSTAATQTITPDVAGIEPYSCQITLPGDCDTTVMIKLKAVPLPDLSVCKDTTICSGGTAILYLTSKNNCPAGTTIVWTSTGGGGGSGDTIYVSPTTTTTYTITAKTPTPLECSQTATVTVNVIPIQTPVVTPTPALLCLDAGGVSEVDLTLSTPDIDSEGRAYKEFKWYTLADPTTILGTAAVVTVPKASITASQTYVVEVTTQEGCVGLGQVEVPVSAKPSVSIKGEDKVCFGKSLVLQAESPINVARYEWTTNVSATPFATTQSVTVFPTATENTYYLTVYNDNDCSFAVNPGHAVTILDAPNPTITPDHNPICEGDDVTLTASDLNGGSCTVVWDDGSTNPVRIIRGLTNTTTYSVTMTNQNGCAEKVEYTVTVNPLPKLKITGNTQVCVGDSVLLSVTDANGVANKYSWTGGTWKEATDQGSVDNSKVWVYPTDISNPTSYCVTSVDVNGCNGPEVCHEILAYSKPIAKINGKQMATDTICVGESLILTASGGTKYKWSTNAESEQITTPVYNAPTSTLAGQQQSYVFWVDVYNEANCVERDSIWIKVAAKPLASITVGGSGATTVCENDAVVLQGSANAVANTPAGTYHSYMWTNNTGETINNPNQKDITVNPTKTTTYYLTVTDNETGCERTVQQIINVNPLPKVSFAEADTVICEFDEFHLSIVGDVTNCTITWEKSKGGVDQPADAVKWEGLTDIYDNPETSDYVYRAHITDNYTLCERVLEHKLNSTRALQPAITIDNGETDIMCQGEIRTLLASNNYGEYDVVNADFVWMQGKDTISTSVNQKSIDVSPRTNTVYTLVMRDVISGCIRSVDTMIVVLPLSQVDVPEPDDQTICEDDLYRLTVNGVSATDNVSWEINGKPQSAWNGKTTIEEYPKSGYYTYMVKVHNINSCDTTITRRVQVNSAPRPSIEFNSTVTDTLCQGETVLMEAKNSVGYWGTDRFTYAWLQGNDTLVLNNRQLSVAPESTTTYTFSITDRASGCTRRVDTTIVVYNRPKVQLNEVPARICAGDNYTLELTGLQSGETVVWEKYDKHNSLLTKHEDGRTSFADNPTVGEYTYYAKVKNGHCDTTLTRKLTVSNAPTPTISFAMGTSDIICEGEYVVLLGSHDGGGYYFSKHSITWLRKTATTLDTLAMNDRQLTQYPQQTTTYMLAVTDVESGCTNIVDTTVVVKPRPAVKLVVTLPEGSAPNTICLGDSITMQIIDTVAGTTTGLKAQWKRNGVLIPEWEDKFEIFNHAPTVPELYEVTVSNATCPIYLNYDLKVNYVPDPTVELRSGSLVNCEGTRVDLGGKFAKEPGFVYEWTSSTAGEVIADATNKDIVVYPNTTTTYTYTVTDTVTGCSRYDNIQVVVNKRPKVALRVDYPDGADGNKICQTEAVTLTLTDETTGVTTEWYKDGVPVAEWANKLSVVDVPDVSTKYSVIVRNTNCELQLDTSIVVNPVPDPSIHIVGAGSKTICEGQQLELAAMIAQDNRYTYRWTSSNKNERFSDATLTNQIVRPTTTTTYTYTVTDPNTGCSRFDTLRIIVNLKPVVTMEISLPATATADSTICAGEAITLRVLTPDVGTLYTKWFANNVEQPQWENMMEIVNVTPDETTDYRVEVSNGNCTAAPLEQRVKVLGVPDPSIAIDKGLQTMCEGEQLILRAVSPQQPGFEYQWLSSTASDVISNPTAQSITVYPTAITTYSYVITDPATGCVRVGQIEINVNKKPNVRLVDGNNNLAKDTLICGGETVTFRVDGDLTNLTFEWYKDNKMELEMSSRYTDMPAVDAKYHVIVTDTMTGCKTAIGELGCKVSVNVMPAPSIVIVGTDVDNQLCKGESITLKGIEDQPHNETEYIYQWYDGGRPLSRYGYDQQITVAPTATTTYIYKVTSIATGCERSADTTIYVYDRPQVVLEKSMSEGETYCAGDPITLSVKPVEGTGTNADDLKYQWLRNNEVLPETSATLVDRPMGAADNLNDTVYNYVAIVQNKHSLCQADLTNLTFSVTVKPLPVPTISVYDNNGAPITASQLICPNRNIRLQGTNLSGKPFEYIWYSQNEEDIAPTEKPNEVWVSPATTTTYTLTVRNKETGCERSATTTVHVQPVPNIMITSSAKVVDGKSVACVNDPEIILKVVAADGSELNMKNYIFYWYEDGTEIGKSAEIVVDALAASTRNYTVEVINRVASIACPVTAAHQVVVMEAPTTVTIDAYVDDVVLPEGGFVCAGSAVKLEAKKQPNMTYEWRDNWGTIYTENNKQTFEVYPQKTTTYTVKVTNMAGCSYEVSRQILVNALPTVAVSGIKTFCLETVGETFTLTATANPYSSKNTEIVWTYQVNGGTNTYTGTSLKFTPQTTGEFVFTVVARHTANGITCESVPATHIVNVAGVPQVGVADVKVVSSQNGQACINTPIEFEATAGYTKYVFGKTDGTIYTPMQESDLNTWNTIQTVDGTWMYYCDFYNAAGCRTRQTIMVKVNQLPDAITISAAGTDTYNYVANKEITICEGGNVTLTADASGNDNVYSWRDTDGKVWGTAKAVTVDPKLTTEYQLIVTNASGCQVTSKFTVKVIPMDKLIVTANKVTGTYAICQGSTDKVALRVEGSSSSYYDWYSSLGEKLTNQPSSIVIAAPTQDVEWFVSVTSSANANGTNCKSIASVKIDVVPLPNNATGSILVENGSQTVCAGATVVLVGDQADAETYRWSTGEIKPQISVTIPNFINDTVVEYWAIGRNSLGCENTADTMRIVLNVKPEPEPKVISPTICYESQPLRLEAADKGLTYRWYDETGTEISRKYYCEIKHDEAGIYTYKLTAINNAGCEATISVVVTVVPFKANPAGLTYLCSGSSSQIWVDGCSLAEGYQFRWTYAGNIISTADTITVSALGTYFVEVITPWMTTDMATFEVKQSETPAVKFGTPNPTCQGDRFVNIPYTIIGGNPTSYSLLFDAVMHDLGFVDVMDATMTSGYILINAPTTVPAGTYQVTILLSNPNGCMSGEYRVAFTVGVDLIAEVWDDVIICDNSNHEYMSYQWYRNGERITGATLQYYSELGGFSGEYYVIAYTAGGQAVASCIKSYDNKQGMSVSPNPLKRNQILRVGLPFATDVLFGSNLEIVDAVGRVVFRLDRVDNENDILINYPAGVYMVRVHMQSGEVITEKFVVQ